MRRLNKKRVFGVSVILIGIILFIYFYINGFDTNITGNIIKENNTNTLKNDICGDNICGMSEDCKKCKEDCGCKSEEYCDFIGICRKNEVCGDEICSDKEKNLCCEDCGCEGGKVCNKITQICQSKSIIEEDYVNVIVNNYIKENNINGEIIEITDEYYGEKIVKTVRINCNLENIGYPCEIILFIDDFGNIIDEMQTS